MVNSSKPHWLDRQSCPNKCSSDYLRPVRNCNLQSKMGIGSDGKWSYYYYECKKENCPYFFDQNGRHIKEEHKEVKPISNK